MLYSHLLGEKEGLDTGFAIYRLCKLLFIYWRSKILIIILSQAAILS